MLHRPRPMPMPSPACASFLAAFWAVSALAFVTRLERYSPAFTAVASLLLGLGTGAVLLALAGSTSPGRRGRA